MDRRRARQQQRCCSHCSSDVENCYDAVDDQEDTLAVHILPARPLNETGLYADRDLLWSGCAPSPPPAARCPPRTAAAGPAVNRDLKPGRQKIRLEEQIRPAHPADERPLRRSPSPPAFALELLSRLRGPTPNEPCRRGELRATRKAEFNPGARGTQTAPAVPDAATNHRHSWGLETPNLDQRSQRQNCDRASLPKRHHHEWPQMEGDAGRRDFAPLERPPQTYCEEYWYVGACNRADAEHALHLVNKDGAFLVRDCSVNTNSEPLVLAVYHGKKVYNVKIRFIESAGKYALGTGQWSNDMFDSVADIIKFYTIFPITLISGRNVAGSSKYPENCMLTCPVTRRDVEQLLQ